MGTEEEMQGIDLRKDFIGINYLQPNVGEEVIVLQADGNQQRATYIGHKRFDARKWESNEMVLGWHYDVGEWL